MHFLTPDIFFIANLSVGPIESVLGNISANESSPLEILKLEIWLCSTTEKVQENFPPECLHYNLSKNILQ